MFNAIDSVFWRKYIQIPMLWAFVWKMRNMISQGTFLYFENIWIYQISIFEVQGQIFPVIGPFLALFLYVDRYHQPSKLWFNQNSSVALKFPSQFWFHLISTWICCNHNPQPRPWIERISFRITFHNQKCITWEAKFSFPSKSNKI